MVGDTVDPAYRVNIETKEGAPILCDPQSGRNYTRPHGILEITTLPIGEFVG